MPRRTANDIELDYELSGSGETLVLVHGSWSDRDNWRTVVPGLARSFGVVVYDRRGHGLSERDVHGSRRDQEDDLAALIEGLGHGSANVVGTSFGGAIALGLAARRPELVRSLIVHEPPLVSLLADVPEVQPELAAVQSAMGAVLARVASGDARGAARQFVDEVAFRPGAWEQLPPPLRDTMVDTAPSVLAEQQDPMWATLGLDALTNVACPVLLTQGDESPDWFRRIVAKLAGAIGPAEVRTYPGAGHAPHLTHPSDFVTTVTDFLSRSPERDAELHVVAG